MPDISFVYLTNRPGGLDLLALSMTKQIPGLDEVSEETQKQFKDAKVDWELIVVDDWPGRQDRGIAPAYLSSVGLPLSWYGRSKPKWYRDSRQGLANAMNTGLVVARGKYVVFVHDFSMVPSWAPAAWLHYFECNPRSLLHGVAMIYKAKPSDTNDDIFTWKDNAYEMTQERIWFPDKFELFYLGLPMRFAEKIGGIDERGDYCGYWNLDSLSTQAHILDYDLKIMSALYCWQIDHRQWGTPVEKMLVTQRLFDNLWKGWGDVTSLRTFPCWTVPSMNGFSLKEEREKYNQQRKSREEQAEKEKQEAQQKEVPK